MEHVWEWILKVLDQEEWNITLYLVSLIDVCPLTRAELRKLFL